MTVLTTSKWTIDLAHSEVQFKVKHLAISNVSGTFNLFSGEVHSDTDDFQNAQVSFQLLTSSIDTNNSERDTHLKSTMFLDVEQFPDILFNGFIRSHNEAYRLVGELTIKGITQAVTIEIEHTGTGTGRFGDTRAGFEGNAKINRKDFGLTFHLLTEAGSLVVGEEIKLHFDIQLIKQAPEV
ncbi:YceI family protein [Cytophagaceae bacterium YF14B1]|uniref:YceI family protein n=1 Tax=Xanthocytophaga flava TaxID=3048013 RepID=A0AAE3QT11_9BACT|nr:YceI family protein [Xanthocytophaga flavus]MDJ1482710.1 YceI family protein [Xanthocytophaga flavus]